MSTFDQHRALLLEIIAEMSPEELDEALKPVDWEAEFRAMPIELEPGLEQISPDLLYPCKGFRALIIPNINTNLL